MKFVCRAVLACLATLTALAAMPLPGQAQTQAAAPAPASVKVEGQLIDGRVRVANTELRLNGTGVRQVAWFKGYVAALYLTSRANTLPLVLDMVGPKRLQMRMLQDVPAAEFTKALRKGVTRNTPPAQRAGMAERIDRFARLIDAVGKVRKGDVVDLDFEPRRGLLFSLNGTLRGEPIPGDDLYTGLLRAFVGDEPYDDKLKAGLLGRPA